MTADQSPRAKVRSILLSGLVVLSLVAIGTVGLSGMAAAETELTSCTDITSSGKYVLGADLMKDQTGNGDACIEITADGVYLDGQGHEVVGGADVDVRDGNFGILVSGAVNVTVTDVVVREWDLLGTAIRAENGAGITVTDVEVRNNTFGARMNGIDVFTLEDVRAEGNDRTGIQVYDSTDGTVRNVTVVESAGLSGWGAIYVRGGSSGILVENATATSNDASGIFVTDTTSNVNVTDVTATGNNETGLRLETADVEVGDVTAYDNNWSVAVDTTDFVEIPSLNLGESTAPDTTLTLEAMSVRVRGIQEPEQNSNAADIGRYFEVEGIDTGIDGVTGQYDVAVHYEDDDLGRIDESTLSLWWFHPELNPGWGEISGSELEPGNMVNVTASEFGVVGVFGDPLVYSFDVSAVNETIVKGEPLYLEFTNVTGEYGQPFDGPMSFTATAPNGDSWSPTATIENGEQTLSLPILDGNETESLPVGEYTDLEVSLDRDASINDTYDVEIVASPVASFEVEPVNDPVVHGEDLDVNITNVTHVRGGAFSGELEIVFVRPSGVGIIRTFSIEDGRSTSSGRAYNNLIIENLEQGDYTFSAELLESSGINTTFDATVKTPSFEVDSLAGVVHDDGGMGINATWLPPEEGEVNLTVADAEIQLTTENHNISTTVDLSDHLDPETTTGVVTVELDGHPFSWNFGPLTDEVRLVHEAYDLDEGYTRWSIPQPADIYVSDGVVDMTQWSNAETSYDDVGFDVNTGETVTDGEDLHKGLYVNAGTPDERIGYDFVTPGEEGLSPGGAEPISEGWNLLSSNYDVSSGNQTLNLDLNTVSSLPATAADYEGDEGMVAHDPSSFVRIGGDDVVDPYDTYWVYVDVGVDSETRAISTAEYDPAERAAILEALADGET